MPASAGLSTRQAVIKRLFDVVAAILGLLVTAPVLAIGWLIASLETRANGIFRQVRVGQGGELFEVMKLRTMRVHDAASTVTVSGDARITRSGAVMRKLKIDELPQLVNVLRGEMSLVGPRPDVPGYADRLEGADRIVLTVRPGITSPASLAFRHEEELLAAAADPDSYNRDIIWPEKVRLNREYVERWTFANDLRCIAATVASVTDRPEGEG